MALGLSNLLHLAIKTVSGTCIEKVVYKKMPPKKKSSSSKSKEKKLRRKQEQAEVAAALAKVKVANDVKDHMESLTAFRKYTRNELDLTISFQRISDMAKEDVKWSFDLMKECVEELYVRGGWGWNDRKKWDELTHDSACYLIARESESGKPVGFINFRFDLDESVEVVYCYEVHLCSDVRRKGLGKFLMQILELIGHRADMKKIVLTIFKENVVSNSFFRDKMKFVDDESSPLFYDPLNEDDYTYSILSKTLTKKPAKPVAGAAKPVTHAVGNEAPQATHDLTRQKHRVKVTSSSRQDSKGCAETSGQPDKSMQPKSNGTTTSKGENDCLSRTPDCVLSSIDCNGVVVDESSTVLKEDTPLPCDKMCSVGTTDVTEVLKCETDINEVQENTVGD